MLSRLPSNERARKRREDRVSTPPVPRDGQPHAPADGPPHERDLIARARAGDDAAVAALYAAHHPVALGVARRLCRPSDVDDVVSEAFTKVLDQIARGGGPRVSFRAYLITAVRSVSADVGRARARLLPTDTVEELHHEESTQVDEAPQSSIRSDSELLAQALGSLPSRWQLVIWWTTVEGRSLADVGAELGLNANAVAALSFRARHGLRDAYLALHVGAGPSPDCDGWRADFPAFARERLEVGRSEAIEAHVLDCTPCREVIDELRSLLAAGVSSY